MVIVVLMIIRRADVLEPVNRAAFGAALDGPVATDGAPEGGVTVRWRAGAADVLFVAEAFDDDWVLHRTCR